MEWVWMGLFLWAWLWFSIAAYRLKRSQQREKSLTQQLSQYDCEAKAQLPQRELSSKPISARKVRALFRKTNP